MASEGAGDGLSEAMAADPVLGSAVGEGERSGVAVAGDSCDASGPIPATDAAGVGIGVDAGVGRAVGCDVGATVG